MTAQRLAPESLPSVDAALFVQEGSVGAHVGVLYRVADGKGHRLLHQAWHYESRDEELADVLSSGELLLWVPPGLDVDEQADLRTHAALVAHRIREGGIPYAFRARNASISPHGDVDLGSSFGLTCATFVMRLFDAAKIPLLVEESWETGRSPERKEQDRAAQTKLVGYLGRKDRNQAKRVDAEIGCTRIRAEEVAAASGIERRPVDYALVEPAGRQLLVEIQNLKAASLGAANAAPGETGTATLGAGYEASQMMGTPPKASEG